MDIYQFRADYDHRDHFAGNADLAIVDNGALKKNKIFTNQEISDIEFKFTIQNAPLVQSDMLSADGNASKLIIMSEKLIEILDEINKSHANRSPALIAGIGKSDFSVIQAPVLDIFDWERSEYDKTEVLEVDSERRLTGSVEKYVFTVPDDNIPAIFRVQTAIGPVFMRGDVREILKERGIRGIAYKKPGKFSPTNQFVTDIAALLSR